MCVTNTEIHLNTYTRQPRYVHKPEVKLLLSQITFKYKGATIWNNISSKFTTNIVVNIYKIIFTISLLVYMYIK